MEGREKEGGARRKDQLYPYLSTLAKLELPCYVNILTLAVSAMHRLPLAAESAWGGQVEMLYIQRWNRLAKFGMMNCIRLSAS